MRTQFQRAAQDSRPFVEPRESYLFEPLLVARSRVSWSSAGLLSHIIRFSPRRECTDVATQMKSIANIRKITSAMKMVAASKLRGTLGFGITAQL